MLRSCAIQNVEEVRDFAVAGRSVLLNTNMNGNICVVSLAWLSILKSETLGVHFRCQTNIAEKCDASDFLFGQTLRFE